MHEKLSVPIDFLLGFFKKYIHTYIYNQSNCFYLKKIVFMGEKTVEKLDLYFAIREMIINFSEILIFKN